MTPTYPLPPSRTARIRHLNAFKPANKRLTDPPFCIRMSGMDEQTPKPTPKSKPFFLTLGQAAKQVGKSKGTISHAIKTGRLSVYEKTEGGYKIDPAELFRVFTPLNPQTGNSTVQAERSETGSLDGLEALQIKLEAAERLLADREQTITDLRKRLDQLTLLIPAPAPKKSFWARIFSKS